MGIPSSEFESHLKDLTFPVAVAVSGGPDSLALLHLTHAYALKKKKQIFALTVNHGLRHNSEKEALFVKKIAEGKGIPHVILNWIEDKPFSRIQEKAREARYHLLLKWCKDNAIPTLLLGHHQQDQEETFWLRLFSGSGLDGLTGMKYRIEREGILVVRPFLFFSKERLKATLIAEKQGWIEDPSNKNTTYFRGRFRSFAEKEGLSKARLLNVMTKIQEDADFIQNSLKEALHQTVHLFEEGYFSIQNEAFEKLHPALAKRMISFLVRWFSKDSYPPRSTQVGEILKKLKATKAFTSGGAYWIPQATEILVLREVAAMEGMISLSKLEKPFLWDNRFWVDPLLKNQVSKEETFLAPLGAHSFPKEKIISSIPPSVWPTLPALLAKGKIVSIPHFCYNIDKDENQRKFFYLKPLFYDSLMFTI